ncbi:MAG: hypothetical protein WA354_16855 [Terracidiphilus sp.]
MKSQMKMVAAALLAASLVGSYAYAGAPPPPPKKKQVAKKPPKPTVEDQINALRQEFQGQIDTLKSDLAAKDAQLKQAQQTANDAQAAAQKAQADATAQQSALTENAAAVSTLQSTVTDMKTVNATVVSSLTDEATSIKKSIASPDVLHYKGITISPAGSFLAAETVWRSGATGGDINTPFTGIPLDHAEAAGLSEFFGSGRQSRLAIKAIGKLDNVTMTGYYEMDFLSAGVTSNNNQSNSYTLRQRQLWADAKLHDGWDFSGGQGWSLATETTQGLTRGSEILPATVDAQYTAGFVWARQYSFRVSKDLSKKFFAGASLENAETLNPAGQNLPTNLLIGSPGVGGGLYNLNANYSFNMTPDFVAKIAVDPGWGHWELFGIARSFRDRIYPTTGTPYNYSVWGGGIGGSMRGSLAHKKVTVGLKGLYGDGVGRYGSSTIADVTLRPNADISPLHGFSALSTVELNPNPRLMVYLNYGGDYIGRDYAITPAGTHVGYGTYTTNMTGCNVEVKSTGSFNPAAPSNCGANNKDVQEFTAGYWYNMYSGPKGRLRYGLQYAWFQRNLWSGAGGTANPGGGAKGTDNMFWTSFRYYLP